MKYIITKQIVNTLERRINNKFDYECNSFSLEEAFIQPISYIKARLNENEGKPSYDSRFLELILDRSYHKGFDRDTTHKLSVIDKKFNSLRDYHRDEYIRDVELEIKTLKSKNE